jgi:exo-1,4-beta-D-glucosaminidase
VKAQVFQKESYRAMVEAFRKNKYAASGILIYRLNSGWPSLCYFLYDYYLRPNGAYAAVQQAYEPLHVQYSYDDSTVVVVNDLYKSFNDLNVTARVVNFDMTEKLVQSSKINLHPDEVKTVFTLPLDIKGLSENYFLSLNLETADREPISSNFYWLSTRYDTLAQYTSLMDLPQTTINAEAIYYENGNKSEIRTTIGNHSEHLAFFINPKILKGRHGEELLPAYWGAKYISLLPGEERELSVTFNSDDLEGAPPHLMVEGWNTDPLEISIMDNKNVTPEYEYANLEIPEDIRKGKNYTISATVKNAATSGEGLLKSRQYMIINGEPFSYHRVALAPGEEKQLNWTNVTFEEKGTYNIRIGSMNPFELHVK